jgi:hypothetical protein
MLHAKSRGGGNHEENVEKRGERGREEEGRGKKGEKRGSLPHGSWGDGRPWISRGEGNQLLRRVGLAVGLM